MEIVLAVVGLGLAGSNVYLVKQILTMRNRIQELSRYEEISRRLEQRVRVQTQRIAKYAAECSKRRMEDEYKRGLEDGKLERMKETKTTDGSHEAQ